MLAAYQAAAWGNRDGADFSVRACEALAAVIEGPWRRINAQMVERVRSDVRRILSTVTVAELVSDHGTRGPG